MDPGTIDALLAERAIRDVVLRYCRGIDRRQFDIVRECYHPDAHDEHGDFTGTVDAFIVHAATALDAFETTTHFAGNILVELNPDDSHRARCEAYVTAIHRIAPRGTAPARDHVVGLRYIDDFEQRNGQWRIANRICVFDWTRTDPVAGWQFTDAFRRGRADRDDIVFAPSLRSLIDHSQSEP